jgi:hypothetical protein
MLRLAALLAAAVLALSRAGLIVHEWAGHGGAAIACGGTITGVRLFWFAGGWVRYRVPGMTPAEDLAIALGGIAIESAIGLALWLALRRRSILGPGLGSRLVRAAGAALVVHAMFYLATGTYHGYGDGRVVRELAGDGRFAIAIAAGLAACAAGWAGARHLFGALVAAVPAPRVTGALLAIAAAALVNAGLYLGELGIRSRDSTYAVAMQREGERAAARDLARWVRGQPAGPSDAEIAARARELTREHREVPFAWLLAAATLAAITAGAVGAPRPARDREAVVVPARLVAVACAAAAMSTAAVIALDATFHYNGG